MSIGGSITTPQNYSSYEYISTIADPSSVKFGKARRVTYDLDGPMVVSFGTGLKLSKTTQVAIDGMFTKYSGVSGLGSPGGIVNRIIQPFGWRNVWTVKAGVQHQVSDKLTVRGGYNYNQMPIRPEVVISATGAPVTFQHHIAGGFGMKIFPFLTAEASAYYVPRQHAVRAVPRSEQPRHRHDRRVEQADGRAHRAQFPVLVARLARSTDAGGVAGMGLFPDRTCKRGSETISSHLVIWSLIGSLSNSMTK